MPDAQSQYIPLLNLALEWAKDSGTHPDMVLRRLCEWAVAGGFPDGAFVISTGDTVPPLELLTAFRLLAGNGHATLGGSTIHKTPSIEREFLMSVLVTTRDVLQFCERHSIRPPSSLRPRFVLPFFQRARTRSPAPPECPDVEEVIARQFARTLALAGLNALRSQISGLSGKPTPFGPQGVGDGPVNLEYWGPRWTKMRDDAQDNVGRSGDEALRNELEALEHEWEAFVAAQSARAGADAEETRVTADPATPTRTTRKMAATDLAAAAEPRLQIWKSSRLVRLEGAEGILSRRSFRLLRILTEAAVEGAVPVSTDQLRNLVDGSGDKAVAQAVYVLKQELIGAGVAAERAGALIENFRATGYRLTMSPCDILIDQ